MEIPPLFLATTILKIFSLCCIHERSIMYTDKRFFKTYVYTYKDKDNQMTNKAVKWKEKYHSGMRKNCCRGWLLEENIEMVDFNAMADGKLFVYTYVIKYTWLIFKGMCIFIWYFDQSKE